MKRMQGDERPLEVSLSHSPMWVQVHGLQIRAMNKEVGEIPGTLLGDVIEVRSGSKGSNLGRCKQIRVLLDISKPLLRWTTTIIEGIPNQVFFRYKKLETFV